MAGRGYSIESVCEASAGATHTRDAAMFQLVEVCVSQCSNTLFIASRVCFAQTFCNHIVVFRLAR